MLGLVQRDDELSPPKGLIAARELISENVAAIFAGIDTPVSMAMVPVLNKEQRIYMGVWAAGTAITRNGADPNYAFASPRSTLWSTSGCSNLRIRSSARRKRA